MECCPSPNDPGSRDIRCFEGLKNLFEKSWLTLTQEWGGEKKKKKKKNTREKSSDTILLICERTVTAVLLFTFFRRRRVSALICVREPSLAPFPPSIHPSIHPSDSARPLSLYISKKKKKKKRLGKKKLSITFECELQHISDHNNAFYAIPMASNFSVRRKKKKTFARSNTPINEHADFTAQKILKSPLPRCWPLSIAPVSDFISFRTHLEPSATFSLSQRSRSG